MTQSVAHVNGDQEAAGSIPEILFLEIAHEIQLTLIVLNSKGPEYLV